MKSNRSQIEEYSTKMASMYLILRSRNTKKGWGTLSGYRIWGRHHTNMIWDFGLDIGMERK